MSCSSHTLTARSWAAAISTRDLTEAHGTEPRRGLVGEIAREGDRARDDAPERDATIRRGVGDDDGDVTERDRLRLRLVPREPVHAERHPFGDGPRGGLGAERARHPIVGQPPVEHDRDRAGVLQRPADRRGGTAHGAPVELVRAAEPTDHERTTDGVAARQQLAPFSREAGQLGEAGVQRRRQRVEIADGRETRNRVDVIGYRVDPYELDGHALVPLSSGSRQLVPPRRSPSRRQGGGNPSSRHRPQKP